MLTFKIMQAETKEYLKKAVMIAFPMMIQQAISNAVGLVDNIMVGSLGTESMTGVAVANQLLFVCYLAIFGALAGPGIYGAQFYGNGDTEGVRQTFRFKLLIAVGFVLLAILVFLTVGEPLIGFYLKGEKGEMDPVLTGAYGVKYLHIMLIGLLPFAITQCYAGTLRETGETFKPMVAGIVSVVVDVVLNYLLIYGKFGFPRLEVRGAAIATVIARGAELLTLLIWTYSRKKDHAFLEGVYRHFRIPGGLAKRMTIKGFPIFVNEFMWSAGQAMLMQCYSVKGLDVVASMNMSNAICNLMNISFISLGNAVGVITGQYLGSDRADKAQRAAVILGRFTALVSAAFAVVLIGLSFPFPNFYKTTQEVRQLARSFIIVTALFFPLQGYINAMYFTLRSGGKTFITFLFDSVFNWVCSVPVAWCMCHFLPLGVVAIYAIVQALDGIKAMIGRGMIRKGVWLDRLVGGEEEG